MSLSATTNPGSVPPVKNSSKVAAFFKAPFVAIQKKLFSKTLSPDQMIKKLLEGKGLDAAKYKETYATIENSLKHIAKAKTDADAEIEKADAELRKVIAEYDEVMAKYDEVIAKAKAEYDKIEAENKEALDLAFSLTSYDERQKILDNLRVRLDNLNAAPDKAVKLLDAYGARRDKALKDFTNACDNQYDAYNNIPILVKHQLAPIVSDEIYREMSRPAMENSPEKAASGALIKLFEKEGLTIDEVRFIDAKTLIDHMNLSDEKFKKNLSRLVDTTKEDAEKLKEIHRLIDTFIISKSTFADTALKKNIERDLHERAEDSQTYRNLILTLIAWSEASPKICDAIADGFERCFSKKIKFSQNLELNGRSAYNEISLCYQRHTLHSSLFGCQSDNLIDGLYWQQDPKGQLLFHEIGHTISANIATADHMLGLDDALSMKIASTLANVVVNPDALKEQIKLINSLEEQYNDSPEKLHSLVMAYNKACRTQCKNVNDVKAHRESVNTLEALIKDIFETPMEILQIAGLHCAKHSGKNILYINKLSDFALRAEMGQPIRYDHSAKTTALPGAITSPEYDFAKSVVSDRFEACGRLAICNGINRPLHEALFQAFGYDMVDYEKRLEENLAAQKSSSSD
ncbi:hypothetical protein FACS1894122_07150 [Alphaproteobacteria bacterium]|nr:hypothetical protein FACS1894122_07150 [Alphaproteobacteria bacterium]